MLVKKIFCNQKDTEFLIEKEKPKNGEDHIPAGSN
jgi:hypothetical protein